jgi:hypothetical protein
VISGLSYIYDEDSPVVSYAVDSASDPEQEYIVRLFLGPDAPHGPRNENIWTCECASFKFRGVLPPDKACRHIRQAVGAFRCGLYRRGERPYHLGGNPIADEQRLWGLQAEIDRIEGVKH